MNLPELFCIGPFEFQMTTVTVGKQVEWIISKFNSDYFHCQGLFFYSFSDIFILSLS